MSENSFSLSLSHIPPQHPERFSVPNAFAGCDAGGEREGERKREREREREERERVLAFVACDFDPDLLAPTALVFSAF